MEKRYISLGFLLSASLAALLFVAGCQRQELPIDEQEVETTDEVQRDYAWIPGEAYIKLSEEGLRAGGDLNASLTTSLRSLRAGDQDDIQVTNVFNIGGEYEAAQRRHGLHRWLKVTFSKNMDVNEVIAELKKRGDVEVAHGGVPVQRDHVTYQPVSNASLRAGNIKEYNGGYPAFTNTDPLLQHQWHYTCDGYDGGFYDFKFEKGADINLFPAWDIETGKKSVIVAVIDAGVRYDHPDLIGSMWDNPKEPGTCGYNFYKDTSAVEPDFHGTHVAGTIAARNNNGIGVCGVAGGDGTPESGVRLMSLQIFKKTGEANMPNKGDTAGNDEIGRAFQFAAENGAVIANCSWGFAYDKDNPYAYPDEIPAAIQAGIDYFIRVAGTDSETGQQKPDAPMKGGVVIFGAGNDSARDIKIVPSHYDEVIAVGAFNREFKVTDYTNTGDWLDILAPGGETHQVKYTGILSTISEDFKTVIIGKGFYGNPITGEEYLFPGDADYAYAQGTSMATPHVSGIAALVVSKFGHNKPGFTNTELKERLLNALKPLNHEEINPSFVGKIGRGYIDAVIALEENRNLVPEAVEAAKITSTVDYFTAKIQWPITKDEDAVNKVAIGYEVYLSSEPLKADQLPESLRQATIKTGGKKEGEELTYKFEGLTDGTTYYVAIVGVDRWGNKSKATLHQFTTTLNHAPEIKGMPESVVLKNTEPYHKIDITLSDHEGHTLRHDFTGDEMEGVSLVRNGNNISITIVPIQAAGTYNYSLTVTDELGKSTTETFSLSVVSYNPPTLVGSVENVKLTVGEPASTIDLGVLFEVASGFPTTYTAESANPNVVEASISEDGKRLTLLPKGEGVTRVTISISDGQVTRSTSFEVSVNGLGTEEIYALYPLPAHSYMKILTKRGIPTLSVTVTTARGEILKQEQLIVNEQTNEATLHTDWLVPGVYTLHINTGNNVIRRTIVKK